MTLQELLPVLKKLSRADKLRATQFLVFELAKEEDALLYGLLPGMAYPLWTPYHAFDAAQTLWNVLEAGEETDHA